MLSTAGLNIKVGWAWYGKKHVLTVLGWVNAHSVLTLFDSTIVIKVLTKLFACLKYTARICF